jgi:ferrous iron transport protein B
MSYIGDVGAAAAKLEVNSRVFGAMRTLFDGAGRPFAYMLPILLYVPRVAAVGAISNPKQKTVFPSSPYRKFTTPVP